MYSTTVKRVILPYIFSRMLSHSSEENLSDFKLPVDVGTVLQTIVCENFSLLTNTQLIEG